jgi:hypothetical protein
MRFVDEKTSALGLFWLHLSNLDFLKKKVELKQKWFWAIVGRNTKPQETLKIDIFLKKPLF